MEICTSNIVADYRVYLENINIAQFSRLLVAVRKISISIKPSIGRSWKIDKKETHHALAIYDRSDCNQQKIKEKDGDRETYPPLACNNEEFLAILNTMLANKVMKSPIPFKVSSKEDRKDPRYCRYHQYVGCFSITSKL